MQLWLAHKSLPILAEQAIRQEDTLSPWKIAHLLDSINWESDGNPVHSPKKADALWLPPQAFHLEGRNL
jgi:hypothetical protein